MCSNRKTPLVETLIKNDFAVVIRANAYDDCAPTIFVHGYGEYDGDPKAGHALLDYFDRMLIPVGGGVAECHEGHQDTGDEVAPPFDLQFAIDVLDDHNGIMHRISCAEYRPDRFVKMAIDAAGLLAKANGRSVGNALARRLSGRARPDRR